jgi:hypothetical protein
MMPIADRLANGFEPDHRLRTARPKAPEHDPEKWKPVFRKDHAQTKS